MKEFAIQGRKRCCLLSQQNTVSEAVIPMGRKSGQKKYRKFEVAGSMHGMQDTYNNIFGNNTFHPIRELS